MTQGHTQAMGAAVRPGSMRTPLEEDKAFGTDHRQRPHKTCRACGTPLHCEASRRAGFCRVCRPHARKKLPKQVSRRKRRKRTGAPGAPMSPDEVKSLRVAAGLRQIDLAERMGVSQSAVAFWETGRRTIDAEDAQRLREICEEANHVNVNKAS